MCMTHKLAVEAGTSKRWASCIEDKAAAVFLPSMFAPDRLTGSCNVCTYASAERNRCACEARRRVAEARNPEPTHAPLKKRGSTNG